MLLLLQLNYLMGAKPVERINTTMATAADSKKHLLTTNIDPTELDSKFISKTNGEDHNNIPSSFYTKNNDIQRPAVQQSHDEECRQHVQQSHAELVIIQQMDNLEENVPFEPKVDKSRREYSDRVDELMTYKGKYGHLKVTLYFFCRNLREAARRALLTGVHHCPIIHLGGPPLGERLVAKKTKTRRLLVRLLPQPHSMKRRH